MEKRIYLINIDEIDGDWEESEKTNDEFMDEAEKQGTVWSIEGFTYSFNYEGGTSGEMKMIWRDLGQYGVCPQLQCFDDSWQILASFKDVISLLAEFSGDKMTENEFVRLLDKAGFKDLTNYTEE